MPPFQVRPFRRADRDQVAQLVNAHAAAVLPGAGASVNTVLQQLEREPDEFVVDPWVRERRALVAEQAGSIVAAALVVRYGDEPDVGPAFRNAGDVRWLVFKAMAPQGNPFWTDAHEAAEALMGACLAQLDRWQVTVQYADGAVPVPGVYGVPEQWPHVERLYERSGFTPSGALEIVHLADLTRIPDPGAPPIDGLQVRRLVGINGTRFTAHRGGEPVGYLEVDVLDQAERRPRHGGLADVGNLEVLEPFRRRGVATWLLAHAAQWLRLGRVDRLLACTTPDEPGEGAFLAASGFLEVTRTRRGWRRDPVHGHHRRVAGELPGERRLRSRS